MEKKTISKRYTALLIACAVMFDLFSLLPVVNVIVVVVGQLSMAYLFSRRGVNLFQGKPAVAYVAATIVEAVPALAGLPLFTVETVAIIVWAKRRAA